MFGFNPGFSDTYKQFFRCYPVTQLDASESKRESGNFGGKIYLPSSALSKLTTLRISYPMLFEIRSPSSKRITHSGVLEFIAPEGRAYLPEWMMETLQVSSGALIDVRSVSLELGKYVKIEPQTVDFLEISDPKAVLENSLRNFSTLTEGDTIKINYNKSVYPIKVLKVLPETTRKGISVVETDLEVDFAPPVGYEEPKEHDFGFKNKKMKTAEDLAATFGDTAGQKLYQEVVNETLTGSTLSGKETPVAVKPVDISIYQNRDAPPLVLPDGQLFFGFPIVPLPEDSEKEAIETPFKFTGMGNKLKETGAK
ncbi:polyubiquitin-binding protein [Starmerella bacillaris]|uniref:Polyubiquitin-binding protein n=1 Tax=Starmerella bacillaris TaxID=1247836 RepID=A0AAV5RFT3_STABA|nr:polyubiquitin-binding protein [Starmerella bacillaris]